MGFAPPHGPCNAAFFPPPDRADTPSPFAPMATSAVTTTLNPDALVVSPRAPAGFSPASSPVLRRHVAAHGVVVPLPVRPLGDGAYEILAWPQVWDAARACALQAVPVTVMEGLSDPQAEALVAQHYPTKPAAPVDPIAQAQAFKAELERLRKTSPHPYRLLSALTGYRRTYLSHAIRLLTLPHQVQRLIRSGALRPRHARCLVTVPGAEAQMACAHEIVVRRLSATQAEALARAYCAAPQAECTRAAMGPSALGKDPDLVRLEQEVSDLTGCPTEIGARSITFRFASLDELDGLLYRLRSGSPSKAPDEDLW